MRMEYTYSYRNQVTILKQDSLKKPILMILILITVIVIVQRHITGVVASLVKEAVYHLQVPYSLFSLKSYCYGNQFSGDTPNIN
ncbi:unnamed protein product [Paramecium pentaurelia]|uniref:Uncharacterized protein n=1 Tax=Paramecium pentaurelia TaxID=43138 RepID=A0A8S1YJS6_9CILI|nr:unnamed protein product [Paramecium pentaurelia]